MNGFGSAWNICRPRKKRKCEGWSAPQRQGAVRNALVSVIACAAMRALREPVGLITGDPMVRLEWRDQANDRERNHR